MFESISWGAYTLTMTTGLGIYYVAIALKFYRPELKAIATGKTKISLRPKRQFASAPMAEAEQLVTEATKDPEVQFTHLSQRIKTTNQRAAAEKYVAYEYKYALTLLLREYPGLKSHALRHQINQLLVSASAESGIIQLTAEEADRLWAQ